MKLKIPFHDGTLGSMLAHAGLVIAILLLLALGYFYIYLPHVTNHNESITVPSLEGMKVGDLQDYLSTHDLRYAVDDSAYEEGSAPLSVLRQFPKAGAKVKEGRVIYVSINRVTPPSLPLPDLLDRSLTNAEVVLRSNELRRGKILYEPSPFSNLIKEMRYNGEIITPGTRIPKGAVIDLVVTDGRGPADFIVGNLVGDSYERALFKLAGWNLHLGKVQVPDGADTTDIEPFVFKQDPSAGDSVRVGDPVDLWIAPKGYKLPAEGIEDKNN